MARSVPETASRQRNEELYPAREAIWCCMQLRGVTLDAARSMTAHDYNDATPTRWERGRGFKAVRSTSRIMLPIGLAEEYPRLADGKGMDSDDGGGKRSEAEHSRRSAIGNGDRKLDAAALC